MELRTQILTTMLLFLMMLTEPRESTSSSTIYHLTGSLTRMPSFIPLSLTSTPFFLLEGRHLKNVKMPQTNIPKPEAPKKLQTSLKTPYNWPTALPAWIKNAPWSWKSNSGPHQKKTPQVSKAVAMPPQPKTQYRSIPETVQQQPANVQVPTNPTPIPTNPSPAPVPTNPSPVPKPQTSLQSQSTTYRWIVQRGGVGPYGFNGLWNEVNHPGKHPHNKITIVGTGGVGSALAFSLVSQNLADELVLIGRDAEKVLDDVKDLQDGSGLIKSPKIIGGDDYELTKDSRICIVTAGVPQAPNQKREELVQKNLKIFEDIIPKLAAHNPNTIIIVVTNPVDILTYATWRLLGKKNTYQIIGSGTNLDSQRLRALIANDLHVSPESVHGWVIGEHGDSSVTAWSGVNVAGVNLKNVTNLNQGLVQSGVIKSGEDWFDKTHEKVVKAAYEVIQLKGRTNWAVALSVSDIVHSIIHDVPTIHAVSTLAQGYHDIQEEVFMSLPCILGKSGVTHILKQNLDASEKQKLKDAGKKMEDIINNKLQWP